MNYDKQKQNNNYKNNKEQKAIPYMKSYLPGVPVVGEPHAHKRESTQSK